MKLNSSPWHIARSNLRWSPIALSVAILAIAVLGLYVPFHPVFLAVAATLGYDGPLLIIQSHGGVTPVEEAARIAAGGVLSGPAGGVAGSRYAAKLLGTGDLIAFDMGGTSTDICLIVNGEGALATGRGVGGHRLALNSLDIASLGAGGGSIGRADAGGILHVGPQSAGALPGPACYGNGGTHATVTDANLVLGYLDPARFLGGRTTRVPFIIGVAGSVAVGKSTTARVLRALLARWADHPRVDLVTTDGFLLPNAELERRGILNRKGFPESFDTAKLLNFLNTVKSGGAEAAAPVYSHFNYDVMPDQQIIVRQPDILIVEGLNVLQPARPAREGMAVPFVSDFFDFSIYIDADPKVIEDWYTTRFMKLRDTAFRDPNAYFHRYATLSEEAARARALEIWRTINLKNLDENIKPTRLRARLILRKQRDHRIESIALRKL